MLQSSFQCFLSIPSVALLTSSFHDILKHEQVAERVSQGEQFLEKLLISLKQLQSEVSDQRKQLILLQSQLCSQRNQFASLSQIHSACIENMDQINEKLNQKQKELEEVKKIVFSLESEVALVQQRKESACKQLKIQTRGFSIQKQMYQKLRKQYIVIKDEYQQAIKVFCQKDNIIFSLQTINQELQSNIAYQDNHIEELKKVGQKMMQKINDQQYVVEYSNCLKDDYKIERQEWEIPQTQFVFQRESDQKSKDDGTKFKVIVPPLLLQSSSKRIQQNHSLINERSPNLKRSRSLHRRVNTTLKPPSLEDIVGHLNLTQRKNMNVQQQWKALTVCPSSFRAIELPQEEFDASVQNIDFFKKIIQQQNCLIQRLKKQLQKVQREEERKKQKWEIQGAYQMQVNQINKQLTTKNKEFDKIIRLYYDEKFNCQINKEQIIRLNKIICQSDQTYKYKLDILKKQYEKKLSLQQQQFLKIHQNIQNQVQKCYFQSGQILKQCEEKNNDKQSIKTQFVSIETQSVCSINILKNHPQINLKPFCNNRNTIKTYDKIILQPEQKRKISFFNSLSLNNLKTNKQNLQKKHGELQLYKYSVLQLFQKQKRYIVSLNRKIKLFSQKQNLICVKYQLKQFFLNLQKKCSISQHIIIFTTKNFLNNQKMYIHPKIILNKQKKNYQIKSHKIINFLSKKLLSFNKHQNFKLQNLKNFKLLLHQHNIFFQKKTKQFSTQFQTSLNTFQKHKNIHIKPKCSCLISKFFNNYIKKQIFTSQKAVQFQSLQNRKIINKKFQLNYYFFNIKSLFNKQLHLSSKKVLKKNYVFVFHNKINLPIQQNNIISKHFLMRLPSQYQIRSQNFYCIQPILSYHFHDFFQFQAKFQLKTQAKVFQINYLPTKQFSFQSNVQINFKKFKNASLTYNLSFSLKIKMKNKKWILRRFKMLKKEQSQNFFIYSVSNISNVILNKTYSIKQLMFHSFKKKQKELNFFAFHTTLQNYSTKKEDKQIVKQQQTNKIVKIEQKKTQMIDQQIKKDKIKEQIFKDKNIQISAKCKNQTKEAQTRSEQLTPQKHKQTQKLLPSFQCKQFKVQQQRIEQIYQQNKTANFQPTIQLGEIEQIAFIEKTNNQQNNIEDIPINNISQQMILTQTFIEQQKMNEGQKIFMNLQKKDVNKINEYLKINHIGLKILSFHQKKFIFPTKLQKKMYIIWASSQNELDVFCVSRVQMVSLYKGGRLKFSSHQFLNKLNFVFGQFQVYFTLESELVIRRRQKTGTVKGNIKNGVWKIQFYFLCNYYQKSGIKLKSILN